MKENIYQFKVKDLSGQDVSLETFKGKVLLIVNTASKCGFTGQYADLEKVYKDYKPEGFEILAFPSDQFNQEPLYGDKLQEFCSLKYHTTFPVFENTRLIGEEASDLYKFLADKSRNGVTSMSPKWNFHKYLVNRDGELVDYFFTITNPQSSKVRKAIEKLLR